MGIVQNAEPVLMSRKMWDGEKIIMISDGILEAMPGNTRKRRSWNLYQIFPAATRRNWQNRSGVCVRARTGGVVDDCTVLVGTMLERGCTTV